MIIVIANPTIKIIPKTFSILIIISAFFSVLFTFSTNTCLISLFNNSSILTFNALDNNFNCSGFGEVSPSSQFDIVCLVTSIFLLIVLVKVYNLFLILKCYLPISFYLSFHLQLYMS